MKDNKKKAQVQTDVNVLLLKPKFHFCSRIARFYVTSSTCITKKNSHQHTKSAAP